MKKIVYYLLPTILLTLVFWSCHAPERNQDGYVTTVNIYPNNNTPRLNHSYTYIGTLSPKDALNITDYYWAFSTNRAKLVASGTTTPSEARKILENQGYSSTGINDDDYCMYLTITIYDYYFMQPGINVILTTGDYSLPYKQITVTTTNK